MQIPHTHDRYPSDGNSPQDFRVSIYNVLVHLKPKYCLEIGSHLFQSSHVFHDYFKNYCPEGYLITCDIKKYCDFDSKHIIFTKVYPHTRKILDWHAVREEDMLANALSEENLNNSTQHNIALLLIELTKLGVTAFDFCFLDGDHTETSFRKDLEIALTLTKPPHYILIDDIDQNNHECSRVYHEEVKNNYCNYELSGMSLIWRGNARTISGYGYSEIIYG